MQSSNDLSKIPYFNGKDYDKVLKNVSLNHSGIGDNSKYNRYPHTMEVRTQNQK